MLEQIVSDMGAFLFIQFLGVVVFAFNFRVLAWQHDAYAGPFTHTLFSAYALLMHGDGLGEYDVYGQVETDVYGQRGADPARSLAAWVALVLYFLFTLLLNLVMLNALIAIMARAAPHAYPRPIHSATCAP